jgi:hypothetical protein
MPLCVHEIARGPNRQEALDKPYAVLVLCPVCHDTIHFGKGVHWPATRQLALLKASRPGDYDMEAYNELVGPPRLVTEEEVEQWA